VAELIWPSTVLRGSPVSAAISRNFSVPCCTGYDRGEMGDRGRTIAQMRLEPVAVPVRPGLFFWLAPALALMFPRLCRSRDEMTQSLEQEKRGAGGPIISGPAERVDGPRARLCIWPPLRPTRLSYELEEVCAVRPDREALARLAALPHLREEVRWYAAS
jgi:hypothetical protein